MLFVFRAIRAFQAMLAGLTLASGIIAVVALKACTDGSGRWYLAVAIVLGLVFLWAFAAALRAPTSFVAVAVPEGRTRIRFAGFVDTVVDNRNILGARMVRHGFPRGLGVRTNFAGNVALATAWGDAVELTFAVPMRVWLIPQILPVKARTLTLSLKNGHLLAEHFGPPATASPSTSPARKMNRRGTRTRQTPR